MLAHLLKQVNAEKYEEQVPFFYRFFTFFKKNRIADIGCRRDNNTH